MEKIRSLDDLSQVRKQAQEVAQANAEQCHFIIRISVASCGVAAGALDVLRIFQQHLDHQKKEDLGAEQTKSICVIPIGCLGLCSLEPMIQVKEVGHPQITYGKVSPLVARKILQQHILQGRIVQENVVELM